MKVAEFRAWIAGSPPVPVACGQTLLGGDGAACGARLPDGGARWAATRGLSKT